MKATTKHPLDQLDGDEVRAASAAARQEFGATRIRFVGITLHEPSKRELAHYTHGHGAAPARVADIVLLVPSTGLAYELRVNLSTSKVTRRTELPPGTQPTLTPDDCFLAEEITKRDGRVAALVRERYGIADLVLLAADPWTINVTSGHDRALDFTDGVPARLCQMFLYRRDDPDDNFYAHPLDALPIVDLNALRVVAIQGVGRPAPPIPSASVNFHRAKLASNSYLAAAWRSSHLAPLEVLQPQGPSFQVQGNHVTWQKWAFRVGFNWREGLVLHDLSYEGRSVLSRAALVEMSVPYGDPNPPFQSKCAFDVGDFGLGFCANSLALGCDCLGHIHYFDAMLNDSAGEPYTVKKAVCMHEEDAGLAWKHVEYRTQHSEARRSRKLVVSFITTIANYEYLMYWYLMQDGSIELDLKLSGLLSTNLLSEGEVEPRYGVLVAPGVNSQVHQHMFCVRLDVAVDGPRNTVAEYNVEASPLGPANPYGNAFRVVKTPLRTEQEAIRLPAPGRVWKVSNPRSINPLSGQPVAYKLVPGTRGAAQPMLLMHPDSAVSVRGEFATRALWVTPHHPEERFPAGEYPTQSVRCEGLPVWCAADRPIVDAELVLWHSFGVTHIPRIEDFPVMPCESVGFSFKPDGFFLGNPALDIAPTVNLASKCCSHRGQDESTCKL